MILKAKLISFESLSHIFCYSMKLKEIIEQKGWDKQKVLEQLSQIKGKELKRLPSTISEEEFKLLSKKMALSDGKVIVVKDDSSLGEDFLSALGFEEKKEEAVSSESKEEVALEAEVSSQPQQEAKKPKQAKKPQPQEFEPLEEDKKREIRSKRKGYVSFGR